MVNKKGHRRFGNVRKRASGRYQASYLTPEGRRQFAAETFERKGDAVQWLVVVEGEMLRGEWADPSLGRVLFGDYGAKWIEEHKISVRTREEYRSIWRNHVEPFLAPVELAAMTTGTIRTWRASLLDSGRSEDRTAKAYRLVRAIMNTAVDDGRVKRNPCRIKGAGEHRTPERTTATVEQVFDVAGRMPERFRALVLAAAFTGLRWGELVGLRRCDIDLNTGTVYVRRKLAQLSRGGLQAGPTKSAAGVRNVAIPDFLGEELRTHIENFAGAGAEGMVFRGERGAMLRRGNFGRAARWPETVVKAGLPAGFHFHDLRHTGNQLAANSGATTRELMHRMGHGSMRAAIIYQHASTERDRRIADEMGAMVERKRQPRPPTEQHDDRASEHD